MPSAHWFRETTAPAPCATLGSRAADSRSLRMAPARIMQCVFSHSTASSSGPCSSTQSQAKSPEERSIMRPRESKRWRRNLVCAVERLNGRLLLTAGPAQPISPQPATAQIAPALDATLAQAYETSVERLDDQFVSQAQQLDYLLVARIDHFEAILASNASRAAARVEQSLAGTMRTRRASLATGNAMLEAQLNHQIAFFNTQSTRLTANVEEQTANLSVEFQQLDSQFATPAAAFSANLRAAATAFSSDFSNALNSAPTVFQNATGGAEFPVQQSDRVAPFDRKWVDGHRYEFDGHGRRGCLAFSRR